DPALIVLFAGFGIGKLSMDEVNFRGVAEVQKFKTNQRLLPWRVGGPAPSEDQLFGRFDLLIRAAEAMDISILVLHFQAVLSAGLHVELGDYGGEFCARVKPKGELLCVGPGVEHPFAGGREGALYLER